MENPKDNKFKNWLAQEKDNKANLTKEKAEAQAMYEDLSYGQEYQSTHRINKFLRIICNLASFATGALAIWIVLSFIMGVYLSAFIAILTSMLFELKKNQYNNIGFKYLLKYKNKSKKITWPMYGAAFISIALSIAGALKAPELNPMKVPILKLSINMDSLVSYHQEKIILATIDAQKFFDKHKKRRKDGNGFRWSTHKDAKPYKQVHKQKEEHIKEEKKELITAINLAKEKNNNIEQKNSSLIEETKKNHKNNLLLSMILLVITAILFEIAYYYLSYEMAWYKLRVFIDDLDPAEQKKALEDLNEKSLRNLLSNQNQNLNSTMQIQFESQKDGKLDTLTSNVMTPSVKTHKIKDIKLLPGQKICKLEECSKIYNYFRIDQKFCQSDCRKIAHMKKKLQEKLEDSINKQQK